MTRPPRFRFFPAASQILLVLALCAGPLIAQNQSTGNHLNAVQLHQSQAAKAREKFINALQKIKANASSLESIDPEKAFLEYQKDCSTIKDHIEQRLDIIQGEYERIVNSDLPKEDKKELSSKLSENIQKLSRIKKSLENSMEYISSIKPAEWKRIHSNWSAVSGLEKANERISSEIDAFLEELPEISEKSYLATKYSGFEVFPGWFWKSLFGLLFLGLIIAAMAKSRNILIAVIALSGILVLAWWVNLVWRAILALF